MSGDGWPYTEEQWTDYCASGLTSCALCGEVNHDYGYVHEHCRDAAAMEHGRHKTDCAYWVEEQCECQSSVDDTIRSTKLETTRCGRLLK